MPSNLADDRSRGNVTAASDIKAYKRADYWLMCYLEHNNIIDHGGGIRCGWWNGDPTNPYYEFKLLDSDSDKIMNWIFD